jgi:hypothetical protein
MFCNSKTLWQHYFFSQQQKTLNWDLKIIYNLKSINMKKILLLLMAFVTFYSNAQTCEYVPDSDSSSGRDPLTCNYYAANTGYYCLNIRFHIVRDNNGANGYNPANLYLVINTLNTYLNGHNINVASLSYDYIDNTAYNDFDTSDLTALGAINSSSDAFDFYLVNYYNGPPVGVESARNIVVQNSYATTSVSAHEFGHALSLQHINQGTACAGGENSSNCLTCLDGVCDTYASDTYGIMNSEYPGVNQQPFTTLQGLRMRNYIKCYVVNEWSNRCAKIDGANRICSSVTSQTYTLSGQNVNSSVTWSVTSNLQILSSTATSVNIKPLNTSVNGMATITANVGGTLVTKDIFIGKPVYNVVRDHVEYCDASWHYLVIEIVNFDTTVPTTGYTYSFVTPPGITYTALGSNKFRFRLPTSYVGYFELLATVTNSCGSAQNYSEQDVKLCGTFTYQYSKNGQTDESPDYTADSKSFQYKVYPNPSDDILNIELREGGKSPASDSKIKAELFDMFGERKASVDINNNKASIDVSRLNQGVYLLKVNIDGQIETHQVMVK